MIMLSAKEVEERFASLQLPYKFTPAEKQQFNTTDIVMPGERVLGFATPSSKPDINLLDLRKFVGTDPAHPPSLFDHSWYLDEPFSTKACPAGWHFLHMDVMPETINQPVHYVSSLASSQISLPTAIEVVLMLFLHYVGTGEHLLLKKHTWCSDSTTLNRCVTVGAFGRNGVFVSSHPPTYRSQGLGLCGKLNVPGTPALLF